MKNQLAKPSTVCLDKNVKGWESVATKWKNVGWPRRPNAYEIAKIAPLLECAKGGTVGIFGATPEYRAMLSNKQSIVYMFEKSQTSIREMDKILSHQFKKNPSSEVLVREDWENLGNNFDRKSVNVLIGDIIYGYMQTKERLESFIENSYKMLRPNGKFILRDFVNIAFESSAHELKASSLSADEKRWAYILISDFAIEGNTFYEQKLADNLLKLGDMEVFKTCATTPRERLMLEKGELEAMFSNAGFDVKLLSPPITNGKAHPGIWVFEKN